MQCKLLPQRFGKIAHAGEIALADLMDPTQKLLGAKRLLAQSRAQAQQRPLIAVEQISALLRLSQHDISALPAPRPPDRDRRTDAGVVPFIGACAAPL
jgi:hypothetical protein